MTAEELEKAVQKLIEEANASSSAAKEEYEQDCLRAKYRALEQRIDRSTILADRKNKYDALVLQIQKDLDESLEALYAEEGTGGTTPPGIDPGEAPYEVDYTLAMRDRYVIVKNYYLGYDDMAAALSDFEKDEIAKDYLGSYYDYLLQLLLLVQ